MTTGEKGDRLGFWELLREFLLRHRGLLWALLAIAASFGGGVWGAVHFSAAPDKPIKIWGLEYTKSLPVRDLYLRVEDARGPVVLTARINDEKLQRWGNQRIGTAAPQPYNSFSIAANWHNECMADPSCANRATETLGNVFHRQHQVIDTRYKQAFDSWWESAVRPAIDHRPESALSNIRIASRSPSQLNFEIETVSKEWQFTLVISEREGRDEIIISRIVIDERYAHEALDKHRREVAIDLP
jgi:hypothetical protein